MRTEFQKGNLVEIVREGNFTLCSLNSGPPPTLRECPVTELEVYRHPQDVFRKKFTNIEGKVGLIVYVARNRLEQPLGYRVLIEGRELFCKASVAVKYFKLVGQQNESRGSGEI
jgi:hypothetical protein